MATYTKLHKKGLLARIFSTSKMLINTFAIAKMQQRPDSVIVESVLVKMIEQNSDDDDIIIANISELLADMRQAMDKIV